MVITIDGPAGKSTVAQTVAQQLGFDFLDTGAMYRALGLAALRRNTPLEDVRELAFVAKHSRIEFDWSRHPPTVMLNGESVGHLLRGSDATRAASYVAIVPAIREQLVEQQRQIGHERANLVTEGRDATPLERARRRVAQLRSRGEVVDAARVLEEIVVRDRRDASRCVGPLAVPEDARVIDTTELAQDQVVERIVGEVLQKSSRDISSGDTPSGESSR
jgi:cytidylate kinase